jgi:hypothetical protein
MTTNSWIGGSGSQSFGGAAGTTDANWSSGHVPKANEEASISTSSATTLDVFSSSEDVGGITVGSNDELDIDAGTTFTTNTSGDGGTNVINGKLVVNLGELVVGTGNLQGSGLIELASGGPVYSADLVINGTVNADGTGSIEMNSSSLVNGNTIESTSGGIFTNNETLSGTGTIGNSTSLSFINDGTVSTGSGGPLEITGSTGNGTFTNTTHGVVEAADGGTLDFGVDGQSSTIGNSGTISLDSTGNTTKLEIAGNVTINGSSTGAIVLEGNDPAFDSILSDGKTASLTLVNQTLKGAGVVGDTNLTLDVSSGSVIDADVPLLAANSSPLFLNTGSNTIMNAGTLETTNGGTLEVMSAVDNTGTILSSGTGNVELFGSVTGPGTIDVGAGSFLALEGGSVSGNVNFTGANAQLFLSSGEVAGSVTGAVPSDEIFMLGLLPSVRSGAHAVWQQTSSAGGTLSLYKNGDDLANVNMTGQFNSLDFALAGFGRNAETITVQNTPTYADNPGNNDEWILSDGNWVESAGPGSHPSGYNVALTGDWTGSGTDGILWFNPTTGDADEWQLSNTQWSASADLGSHPANATDGASYQIAGTDDSTDFTGNGIDDVLWTSTNSDGTIATDIWELSPSGNWAASVSPGNHPAGYSVAGTGDWTGSGTDGILWFNSSTGDTDEWQLSGGNWAASVDLGTHPTNATDGSSYQIAGIGDFFDNGRDDVLWTSVNSDGTVATDIWELNSSGQWMASVSPGNHPAGYSVIGVGDFTGTGTSDILWQNASTGDTEEWLINNGNWAGSIDLGTHPGGFQVAGVGDFNGAGNAGVLWHAST